MRVLLHIGGDVTVRLSEVVAIIDVRAAEESRPTREYLQLAQSEGNLRSPKARAEAKSFVVTSDAVFWSPVSAQTLRQRSDILRGLEENRLGAGLRA